MKIYSNDGPGLCTDIVDMAGYEEIRHKVIRIIPEFSLIGKLFERDEPDLIVRSSVQGAMAHDGFTWEIEGDRFVSCPACSADSHFFNEVFDEWIESAGMEQREAFTKNFSVGFFWLAYDKAKKAACRTRSKPERFCHGAAALFSLLFGILPVTAYALEITTYTLTAGTFVLMYGIAVIGKQIYREG